MAALWRDIQNLKAALSGSFSFTLNVFLGQWLKSVENKFVVMEHIVITASHSFLLLEYSYANATAFNTIQI